MSFMIILLDDGHVFLLLDQDVLGAESLLTKYISQLCNHITETLPIASSLAATSSKHFSLVVSILKGDVIGTYSGETVLAGASLVYNEKFQRCIY
jgi:hypothetical protein